MFTVTVRTSIIGLLVLFILGESKFLGNAGAWAEVVSTLPSNGSDSQSEEWLAQLRSSRAENRLKAIQTMSREVIANVSFFALNDEAIFGELVDRFLLEQDETVLAPAIKLFTLMSDLCLLSERDFRFQKIARRMLEVRLTDFNLFKLPLERNRLFLFDILTGGDCFSPIQTDLLLKIVRTNFNRSLMLSAINVLGEKLSYRPDTIDTLEWLKGSNDAELSKRARQSLERLRLHLPNRRGMEPRTLRTPALWKEWEPIKRTGRGNFNFIRSVLEVEVPEDLKFEIALSLFRNETSPEPQIRDEAFWLALSEILVRFPPRDPDLVFQLASQLTGTEMSNWKTNAYLKIVKSTPLAAGGLANRIFSIVLAKVLRSVAIFDDRLEFDLGVEALLGNETRDPRFALGLEYLLGAGDRGEIPRRASSKFWAWTQSCLRVIAVSSAGATHRMLAVLIGNSGRWTDRLNSALQIDHVMAESESQRQALKSVDPLNPDLIGRIIVWCTQLETLATYDVFAEDYLERVLTQDWTAARSPYLLSTLEKVILSERPINIRIGAVNALTVNLDRDAFQVLVGLGTQNLERSVRKAAVQALGKIVRSDSVAALLAILDREPDKEIVDVAVATVVEIARVAPNLLELYSARLTEKVVTELAHAAINVRFVRGELQILGAYGSTEQIADVLISSLSSKDHTIVHAGGKALNEMAGRHSELSQFIGERIIALLNQSGDRIAREYGIKILGNIGRVNKEITDRSVTILLGVIAGDTQFSFVAGNSLVHVVYLNPQFRGEVVNALCEIILRDENSINGRAAIHYLSKFDPDGREFSERKSQTLLYVLKNFSDFSSRDFAADGLADAGLASEEILAALDFSRIADASPSTRERSRAAFEKLLGSVIR